MEDKDKLEKIISLGKRKYVFKSTIKYFFSFAVPFTIVMAIVNGHNILIEAFTLGLFLAAYLIVSAIDWNSKKKKYEEMKRNPTQERS